LTSRDLHDSLRGTPYLLDDSSEDSAKQLEILVKEADRIQDLFKEVKDNLRPIVRKTPEFLAYQTFHSNKLELQGPDLSRTLEIIRGVEQEDPDDLRVLLSSLAVSNDSHIVEVVGLHSAHLLAERIASGFATNLPFTMADLRQLNVFCIPDRHERGEFRHSDAVNLGQFFDTDDPLWFSKPLDRPVEVSWTDVPLHMQQVCDYISKKQICPPLAAAVAHAWFTHVHPFVDGNGRVARLLANVLLIRNDWPPLIIRHEERQEYLDALEESDIGRIQPLFGLFMNYIGFALEYLSRQDYFLPIYQLENRELENRFKQWNSRATRFIDLLSTELKKSGWHVDRIQMPSATTFQLLEDAVPGAASLLARARHSDGRGVRIGLGYMSNHMRSRCKNDVLMDGIHYPPTIYFQERNLYPNAIYPYLHRNDSTIPIREITFSALEKEPCYVLTRTDNRLQIGPRSPVKFSFNLEPPSSIDTVARRVAGLFDSVNYPGFIR